MSVDFLARDDFRQRIETRPALASHEVATASEGPTKSLPSTPIEPAVDLPNSAEPVDSNPSHASGGK